MIVPQLRMAAAVAAGHRVRIDARSFDSAAPYESLSYVWSVLSGPGSISADGPVAYVTADEDADATIFARLELKSSLGESTCDFQIEVAEMEAADLEMEIQLAPGLSILSGAWEFDLHVDSAFYADPERMSFWAETAAGRARLPASIEAKGRVWRVRIAPAWRGDLYVEDQTEQLRFTLIDGQAQAELSAEAQELVSAQWAGGESIPVPHLRMEGLRLYLAPEWLSQIEDETLSEFSVTVKRRREQEFTGWLHELGLGPYGEAAGGVCAQYDLGELSAETSVPAVFASRVRLAPKHDYWTEDGEDIVTREPYAGGLMLG